MKSKIYVEVMRAQIENSLAMCSEFFSSNESKLVYSLDESDQLFDKLEDGKQVPVYALSIELNTTVEGRIIEKRLWYRRYKITGSLNDIKANALKELADVMMGSFLINATRSDDKTLEKVSKLK